MRNRWLHVLITLLLGMVSLGFPHHNGAGSRQRWLGGLSDRFLARQTGSEPSLLPWLWSQKMIVMPDQPVFADRALSLREKSDAAALILNPIGGCFVQPWRPPCLSVAVQNAVKNALAQAASTTEGHPFRAFCIGRRRIQPTLAGEAGERRIRFEPNFRVQIQRIQKIHETQRQ